VRGDGVLIGDPEQRSRVGDEWMVDGSVLLRDSNALQPLRKTLLAKLSEEPAFAPTDVPVDSVAGALRLAASTAT